MRESLEVTHAHPRTWLLVFAAGLYGFVQWTIMIAVAIAGSLLIRRRWRA